jgi:hypothetical protein
MLDYILFGGISISIGVAAFCAAAWWSERLRRMGQDEMVQVLRSELKDWQNKALLRHGSSILGAEATAANREHRPDADIVKAPRVVLRSQMEARAAQKTETEPQITIFSDGVAYPRVKRETIEKAAEIIDATR